MGKRLDFSFRITNKMEWIGIPNREHVRHQVNQNFGGGRVRMSFTADYPPRSSQQNRYYWGCLITPIMEFLYEQGHDNLNPKMEFFKKKFHRELFISLWTDRVENLMSPDSAKVILQLTPSSSELTTVEFMAYNEEVRRWALETLGLVLFLPNEQGIITYE